MKTFFLIFLVLTWKDARILSASRGKIAPCYFAVWRQNSPNGYFAANAKLALILTLIPTLTLTQTLTQKEEKHYCASRGKIATFLCFS